MVEESNLTGLKVNVKTEDESNLRRLRVNRERRVSAGLSSDFLLWVITSSPRRNF